MYTKVDPLESDLSTIQDMATILICYVGNVNMGIPFLLTGIFAYPLARSKLDTVALLLCAMLASFIVNDHTAYH